MVQSYEDLVERSKDIPLLKTLEGSWTVWSVAFSPCGQLLASTDYHDLDLRDVSTILGSDAAD